MTYVPRHGSLSARLVEFFCKNPEERLSRQDIGLKFDVANTSALDGNLAAAISHGLIIKTAPAEYGAGPELLANVGAPEPTSGFKAWLARKGEDGKQERDASPPPCRTRQRLSSSRASLSRSRCRIVPCASRRGSLKCESATRSHAAMARPRRSSPARANGARAWAGAS